MQKIDVLVIGTEPPCPRCDLLYLLVEELAATSSAEIEVRHCAFDAFEAVSLGYMLGRKIGTAGDVAEAAGIRMDWYAVHSLIDREMDALGPDSRPADAWTAELDAMLKQCEQAADSVGYYMTPVLVVNGTVKHHGSVPTPEQVRTCVLG